MVAVEKREQRRKPRRETLRKITVEVPAETLASAQALTGTGVSDTVREGLRQLASLGAQRAMLKLRGKIDLGISIEDMKHDR